jgi:hypothetical protein
MVLTPSVFWAPGGLSPTQPREAAAGTAEHARGAVGARHEADAVGASRSAARLRTSHVGPCTVWHHLGRSGTVASEPCYCAASHLISSLSCCGTASDQLSRHSLQAGIYIAAGKSGMAAIGHRPGSGGAADVHAAGGGYRHHKSVRGARSHRPLRAPGVSEGTFTSCCAPAMQLTRFCYVRMCTPITVKCASPSPRTLCLAGLPKHAGHVVPAEGHDRQTSHGHPVSLACMSSAMRSMPCTVVGGRIACAFGLWHGQQLSDALMFHQSRGL